MAVFGDLHSARAGPLPGLVESTTVECRCKSAVEMMEEMGVAVDEAVLATASGSEPAQATASTPHRHTQRTQCPRPDFTKRTPISPPVAYGPGLFRERR